LLHVTFGLIEAGKWGNFDLWLHGLGAQAKCGGCGVASVPKVVASFHDAHVDASILIFGFAKGQFLSKSKR